MKTKLIHVLPCGMEYTIKSYRLPTAPSALVSLRKAMRLIVTVSDVPIGGGAI